MINIKNIAGGFAGALALNILHETYKRLGTDAPRIDLVGEEAVTKGMESIGAEPPRGNALFATTLAGDIVSNGLYYSLIGNGKKKNLIWRGAGYGLAAGVGALTLTKPMGLNDAPITKSNQTKVLTVAWYLVGGLVAALAIGKLRE